jgi:MraZ protein
MFFGSYPTTIDDKTRLTLFEKWRAELAQGMILTRGLDQCLVIFPRAVFESIAERVQSLGMEGGDARGWARFLNGQAADVELDKQGRIAISRALLQFAGLDQQAVLVGIGNRIEVWNPAKYEAWETERLPQMALVAERLDRALNGTKTSN